MAARSGTTFDAFPPSLITMPTTMFLSLLAQSRILLMAEYDVTSASSALMP